MVPRPPHNISPYLHQLASKHHIPSGCVREPPNDLPDTAKSLIQQRNEARQQNPNNPIILTIDQQIAKSIAENNRRNWRRGVESCQRTQDTGRLFRLISKVSGKKQRIPPNQPITFNNKQVANDDKIVTSSCKQFTTKVRNTCSCEGVRWCTAVCLAWQIGLYGCLI